MDVGQAGNLRGLWPVSADLSADFSHWRQYRLLRLRGDPCAERAFFAQQKKYLHQGLA